MHGHVLVLSLCRLQAGVPAVSDALSVKVPTSVSPHSAQTQPLVPTLLGSALHSPTLGCDNCLKPRDALCPASPLPPLLPAVLTLPQGALKASFPQSTPISLGSP